MNEMPILHGCRVLLVEDESLIALLAEDVLIDAGCRVTLAMRLPDGLEIARTAALDLAILDVNLGGDETSYPIALALRERRIPFAFVTGYGAAGLRPDFRNHAVIQKPYDQAELLRIAAALVATQWPATATRHP